MTINFLLSIAVALVYGYLLIRCTWPSCVRTKMLLIVLALPAGVAITSASYFIWMIIFDGRNNWYPFAEGGLLFVALIVMLGRFRKKEHWCLSGAVWSRKVSAASAVMTLVLVVVATIFFTISIKLSNLNPWGFWDAWARINLKARFLYAGGEDWTWIFEAAKIYHHDYPLLLQCTVARIWTWNGGINLLTPQFLSILWGVWSLFILFGVVSWLRNPVMASIISLAYLTYIPLQFWSAMQYADIPLACYMVLACAMMIAATQFPEYCCNFLFLAGFFSGSAAWCKNEGIIFAVLIILWLCVLGVRGRFPDPRKAGATLIAGLGIIGSSTVLLKIGFAFKSDLVKGNLSYYELFSNVDRHNLIIQFFQGCIRTYWNGWPLLLLALAFTLYQYPYRRVSHVGTLICALTMLAVYYVVYVMTPLDLTWQLSTTMDRLLLQIWPVLLLSLSVFFEGKDKIGHLTTPL